MPIEYWEMAGYPQEDRDALNNFSATRKLICAWGDRFALRDALLEWPGMQYPYMSSFDVRARHVASEPYGGCSDVAGAPDQLQYAFAVLTVKYETPRIDEAYPRPGNPYSVSQAISEQIEPYVEARRLPADRFKWSSGRMLSDDEAPVEYLARTRYCLTRYAQSAVPVAVRDLPGTCNSGTVTPLLLSSSWSFAPYTLLFEPPTITMSCDSSGQRSYTLQYKFAFKAETWQKFWNADTRAYEYMLHVDTGQPYNSPPAADFSPCFL